MIFGIGVDTTTISRVEEKIKKAHFLQRVYSPEEQAYLKSLGPKRRAETAAGNFAAKEAFLKAAGTGLGGFALADIAALRGESGAPYFKLTGSAAAFCEAKGIAALLSLSHEAGVATAFVVLEVR